MVYKKGTDLEKNIKIQLICICSHMFSLLSDSAYLSFIKAYLYSTIKI